MFLPYIHVESVDVVAVIELCVGNKLVIFYMFYIYTLCVLQGNMAPQLVHNKDVFVEPSQMVQIIREDLEYESVGAQPNSDLIYTLTPPANNPKEGMGYVQGTHFSYRIDCLAGFFRKRHLTSI